MSAARSAGVLLFRRRGAAVEFLLAHPGGPWWAKRDAGAWSIPKGEIEPGEEPRQCALRELGEELGPVPAIEPAALLALGTVRQRSGKVVAAWAAEADFDPAAQRSVSFEMEWPPRSGRTAEFPEVDRVEWLSPQRAREKILPAQAPFLDRALEQIAPPT
ncbi:MAG: NUDIX domain-containing protein [Solirubrobacterales bacterium]